MAPVIYGQIQMGPTKFVVFYDVLICHSLSRDFQSLRAPSHPIHHLHKNTIYCIQKLKSFMLHVQWKIHLQSDVSLIDCLYVYQSVPLITLNVYFFRLPQNCQEVGNRHSFHQQNSPSRLAIPSTINFQDTKCAQNRSVPLP